MKKISSMLVILCLVLLFASCSNNAEQPSDNSTSNNTTNEPSAVKVDEGLLLTTFTVPASFYEDITDDQIKAIADEQGYQSYKINADRSVTYKMTKAKHKEMLKEYSTSIDEYIDSILNGDTETKVESFSKIDHNKDYSEIDIYVNKDAYSFWDTLHALSFYIQGGFYQMFNGVEAEDIDVIVNFIDNATGDIIETGSYRDWANNKDDSNNVQDNTSNESSGQNEIVAKEIELNETVTIGNMIEIALISSEWVETIKPSNESGFYSFYDDQESEKYYLIRGTLKNIGTENIDIQWMNDSYILINDTYKFAARMETETNDGTNFYGTVKPLQTLNLIVYASVSDEAYEIWETIDVTMNILSDSSNSNSFFNDKLPHEVLKISFSK